MKFQKLIKQTTILFLFVLVFTNTLLAQNIECGFNYTLETKKYYDSIKDEIKELENQFLDNSFAKTNSSILSTIPIKAHIVRATDGSGGLSSVELDDAISTMNSIYIDAGIEFFLCDGINYINNDDFYDYETDEENALTSVNNVNGTINIYFTNSIVSSSSGGGLCGYAYFPGGPETILMANSCATNGSTLSHEMGHFFALSHTHGNSNDIGSTEELVNGSNCESTGDFICDTPADPQLGTSNVDFNCQYTGFAQDINQDFYQPDPTNLMSYSRKICRSFFSPQQYARINAIYQVSRSNLGCPSFEADFVADLTESCEANLTVNFTDNSIGATSWNWDVDGDDVIDYTTQNVTHTYTNAGAYDVALIISNGSVNISKVKSQYIEVGAQEISTTTISLSLTLDDWPAETSWEFRDGNETVLYSGGPYIEGVDDFTVKTETFNISTNQCYSFVINDSYGDGICCFSGDGFYELRGSDDSLLATNGNFGFGNRDNFFNGTLSIDKFSTESISLYPNPSSSAITISAQSLPDSYTIYNTLGQVLKQSQVQTTVDLNINIGNLSDGMYFIKLTKSSSSQVLSFIKK
jgi:PKD repeat protein